MEVGAATQSRSQASELVQPRDGAFAFQVAGPSRGEHTSKVHALVDGRGHALKRPLSAGNVVDITCYDKLAISFLAFVSLLAILHWIRLNR